MDLHSKQKFKFLGIEQKKSLKTGNDFEIIKLADPQKYESFDFFRVKHCQIDSSIQIGDDVQVIFELSRNGFQNNLNPVAIGK